jgi:hypothetical protein
MVRDYGLVGAEGNGNMTEIFIVLAIGFVLVVSGVVAPIIMADRRDTREARAWLRRIGVRRDV